MHSLTAVPRPQIPRVGAADRPKSIFEQTVEATEIDPRNLFEKAPEGSGKCPSCLWTGYPKTIGGEGGRIGRTDNP